MDSQIPLSLHTLHKQIKEEMKNEEEGHLNCLIICFSFIFRTSWGAKGGGGGKEGEDTIAKRVRLLHVKISKFTGYTRCNAPSVSLYCQ